MSRNIGFCQFCLSCSGFLFGIGSRWEDVKSPLVDRLLLLVFFSLPNLKELQRFNIWLLLLSSYVEATITTKKFKCLIVWQWCKRQRGKAGPKIAQMFVPWQIKSRDTLWLSGLFNWFVFVGINFEPITPLMNTMIISLPNASLAINIFKELNFHSVSCNYVCLANMFCFLQVWTAYVLCCNEG